MLTFSPALATSLRAAASKEEWCTTLIAALGASRTLVIKRADTDGNVWGTGTTILDAAFVGDMEVSDYRITEFGSIASAVTQIAANLSTGYAVFRITGSEGAYVQGTFGLDGSGRDLTVRASPAANTGYGFLSSCSVGAPPSLPDTEGGGGELRLITTTNSVSTGGGTQTNMPFTFGQPFKAGDFNPVTESLYAKIDGADVPTQVDSISTFPDGTARLAVMNVRVPSIAAAATKGIEIYAGEKITQSTFTPNTDSWDPVVVLTISGVTWTATPRAALLANLAGNTLVRLNGPVCKEVRCIVPFKNVSNADHPHLSLICDVRFYQTGSVWTDMIFENGGLLQTSPSNYTYTVSCTQGAGGSSIFTQASFTHHYRARWRKNFWQGTPTAARPVHNKAYFLDSKITWNYNRTRAVTSTALNSLQSDSAASISGPMSFGLLTTDMPGTGGRPEIAPTPTWTAMWLITQDSRAWTPMIAQGQCAASATIHYRDATSGYPVSVVARPNIAIRYGTSSPSVPATPSGSPWVPDMAHQGSYNFIPYVCTGDHFFLEELTFWAAWNPAAVDPSARGTSAGRIHPGEQLRGSSWGFRSLLEASYALPDGHPMKSYFTTIKNNNITWFNSNLTGTSDNEYITPLGALKGIFNDHEIPGYENDFFMYVITWAVENQETGLVATMNNVARYIVGRFTSETQAAGFCTSRAAHYWFVSRSGGTPYTTWAAYGTANGNGSSCGTVAQAGDPAYPDWGGGYAAVSRGMLGSSVNAGATNAVSANSRWITFTPALGTAFETDPTYDIVAR